MRFFLLILAASNVLLVSCGGSSATSTQSMTRTDATARYCVDQIGAASNPPADNEISVSSAGLLFVSGWAADLAGAPASGVEIAVDRKPYPTTYGVDRPDVAVALKDPSYSKVGFQASIPAKQFSNGAHVLTVRIINKDRNSYFETPAFHLLIQ
jgi:hypothetical protein